MWGGGGSRLCPILLSALCAICCLLFVFGFRLLILIIDCSWILI